MTIAKTIALLHAIRDTYGEIDVASMCECGKACPDIVFSYRRPTTPSPAPEKSDNSQGLTP